MKKVILKLEWSEGKIRKKAMQTVSDFTGVESISIDTNDKKLTVIGDMDEVKVVAKLRKLCHTEIVSVGPAKEPEKKKEEPKKEDDPNQLIKAYQAYYQHYPHYQYAQHVPAYAYHHGYKNLEEDPNGCVIC